MPVDCTCTKQQACKNFYIQMKLLMHLHTLLTVSYVTVNVNSELAARSRLAYSSPASKMSPISTTKMTLVILFSLAISGLSHASAVGCIVHSCAVLLLLLCLFLEKPSTRHLYGILISRPVARPTPSKIASESD